MVPPFYDADTLEIFHGLKLVTTHERDDTPYAYSRKDAHNLPGHHGSYEKDLDEIYRRAGEIDNVVLLYLREVAAQAKYPPKAFRSCRGIMSLEKKYGLDRLVAACACATEKRAYGYQDVLGILLAGDDAEYIGGQGGGCPSPPPLKSHKNIRGRDYFSNNNNMSNEENRK